MINACHEKACVRAFNFIGTFLFYLPEVNSEMKETFACPRQRTQYTERSKRQELAI